MVSRSTCKKLSSIFEVLGENWRPRSAGGASILAVPPMLVEHGVFPTKRKLGCSPTGRSTVMYRARYFPVPILPSQLVAPSSFEVSCTKQLDVAGEARGRIRLPSHFSSLC